MILPCIPGVNHEFGENSHNGKVVDPKMKKRIQGVLQEAEIAGLWPASFQTGKGARHGCIGGSYSGDG